MEKSKIIEKLFYNIVTYSYLVLPLTLLVFFRRKLDIIPIIIALYGIIFFSLLYTYDDLTRAQKKIFQSSYTFIEYSFFAFLFWKNIKSPGFKKLIIGASIFFLVFQITYYFKSNLKRLDSIPIGIETIFIFIFIFYFFYEFSKRARAFYIYSHYCFWVSVGALIYLGGSFFFYILINELDQEQVDNFGILTYMAEILKNLLFTIAMFLSIKHPLQQQEKKHDQIPNLDMI